MPILTTPMRSNDRKDPVKSTGDKLVFRLIFLPLFGSPLGLRINCFRSGCVGSEENYEANVGTTDTSTVKQEMTDRVHVVDGPLIPLTMLRICVLICMDSCVLNTILNAPFSTLSHRGPKILSSQWECCFSPRNLSCLRGNILAQKKLEI